MSDMENTIEQVAQRLHSSYCECEGWYAECQGAQVGDRRVARRLAADGLLAPAPLTVMYAEGTRPPGRGWEQLWGVAFHTAAEVRDRLDGEPGTVIHRYVTGWLPVDGAEGDGRADQ